MQKKTAISAIILVLVVLAIVVFIIVSRQAPKPAVNVEITPNVTQPDTVVSVLPEQPVNKTVKLLFVGDVMLARTIGQAIAKGGDPLKNMKATFAGYDYVIANLETNVSTPGVGTKAKGKLFTFNAPLAVLPYIKSAGVSVVTLANNHTMDYGQAGLLDQIKKLNANEIKYFGAGKHSQAAFAPLILELNGQRIALIGVNDIETWYTASGTNSAGSAYLSDSLIKSAIKTAKAQADIVIIEPHWGFEYYLNYVAAQKDWAHKFIDWGADIVVGGHPHVIEANETYKGKKIYYSLGNFLFDEMPRVPHAGDCQILSVEITDGKIVKQALINVKLDSKGYPYLK